MNDLTEITVHQLDVEMVRLAREIAMDIRPLGDILNSHQLDSNQWESISNTPRFRQLLSSEIEAWQSATNTAERVRLKSLSAVEEALPEFFARMHDPREALQHKNEVLKTLSRFAGVGGSNFDSNVTGEKFSVTINLGTDQTLKIEKDVTAKVIEHED